MEAIYNLFDGIEYTEAEKDVFTEALHLDTLLKKVPLNDDTCLYIVQVNASGSYCVILAHFNKILFREFTSRNEAEIVSDKIVELYGS